MPNIQAQNAPVESAAPTASSGVVSDTATTTSEVHEGPAPTTLHA